MVNALFVYGLSRLAASRGRAKVGGIVLNSEDEHRKECGYSERSELARGAAYYGERALITSRRSNQGLRYPRFVAIASHGQVKADGAVKRSRSLGKAQ